MTVRSRSLRLPPSGAVAHVSRDGVESSPNTSRLWQFVLDTVLVTRPGAGTLTLD